MRLVGLVVAVSLLAVPACAATTPPTPAPIKNILVVRPFTVGRPYQYDWTAEKVTVQSGLLVVLEVDRAFVVRTDNLEPVLYAGDLPVQRLNHGDQSGRVIAIIPGSVNLATTPIWFGTPALPGRVTAEMARVERARAEKAEVRPFSAKKIAAVTLPAVSAPDLTSLLRDVAAQLVYQYSPQEKELGDQWRLPVAKAPERKP
ncbi:MAG TPA: hypothetical protein VF219_04325 [Vicinamibacterales bacterium]